MKYALGEQSFEKIRVLDCVYIDKTSYIDTLLKGNSQYYFLSRPRRFGKSLFISTLEQFFKGNKDLFRDLAIYSMELEWEEYPVIRIDLSNGSFSWEEGLAERLNEILSQHEVLYEIETCTGSPRARFNSLITKLKDKFGKNVVILVDEYEKPLLDTIDKSHQDRFKDELRDFYSVLKDNSDKIKFLFITGVTRLGKINIFSGLNNLTDISLDVEYSAICGITENELLYNLRPGIELFASKNFLEYTEAISQLKDHFDGYHFSREMVDIYNPYSLLTCLAKSQIENTWFDTATPSFLLEILKKRNFNLEELDGVEVTGSRLLTLDPKFQDPIPLLYQTGYLTIKDFDKEFNLYKLGLPNKEVRQALLSAIIPFYLGNDNGFETDKAVKLYRYMLNGEVEKMMDWLEGFFSKVSYNTKFKFEKDRLKSEKDFQFIMYAIFAVINDLRTIHLEHETSAGRVDMTACVGEYGYVFEFKLGENPQEAIDQIEKRGYANVLKGSAKVIYKIGVSFSLQARGIIRYLIAR